MTFPYKLSHEVEDRRYNIQKSPNNRLQEALRSGEWMFNRYHFSVKSGSNFYFKKYEVRKNIRRTQQQKLDFRATFNNI